MSWKTLQDELMIVFQLHQKRNPELKYHTVIRILEELCDELLDTQRLQDVRSEADLLKEWFGKCVEIAYDQEVNGRSGLVSTLWNDIEYVWNNLKILPKFEDDEKEPSPAQDR